MRAEIEKRFVRPLPPGSQYKARLEREFLLVERFKFGPVFLRVMDILALAPEIPHLTRGSAGSSLICYLLGISYLDPVAEKIPLARFMNEHRQDFPDIDLDFPHHMRDTLLQRVYDKWPNQMARISTKIHYRELGAIREALRRLGYRQFVPKYFDLSEILPGREDEVLTLAQTILGRQSGLAKHCGGVVYFENGIPKELQVGPNQIALDKDEIEDAGLIKIDLLCNRGFSQLWEICQRPIEDYPTDNAETAAVFQRGDVIGLTYGESPTFRRMCLAVQPRNILEVAMCLALIRPAAASRGKKREFMQKWRANRQQTEIVFEDDAITWIMELANCTEDEADKFRRGFAKDKPDVIDQFKRKMGRRKDQQDIIDTLGQLRSYSFCKAHALSYARLVWALGWNKVHNPDAFWRSTLRNCWSMYRPWVHYHEALRAGVHLADPQPRLFGYTIDTEYHEKNHWTRPGFVSGTFLHIEEGSVHFRGLIAVSRNYVNDKGGKSCFVTLGFDGHDYTDIILPDNTEAAEHHYVQGHGDLVEEFGYRYVQVRDFQLQQHRSF